MVSVVNFSRFRAVATLVMLILAQSVPSCAVRISCSTLSDCPFAIASPSLGLPFGVFASNKDFVSGFDLENRHRTLFATYEISPDTAVASPVFVVPTVGHAKAHPDNTMVEITSPQIVTLVSVSRPGSLYVQEEDGSAGISVKTIDPLPAIGDRVLVAGVLGTNPDGERVLRDAGINPLETGDPAKPWGMSHRTVGGEGYAGASGLSNEGLLAKVTGRVVEVGSDYVLLDDGSSVISSSPSGVPGLKVTNLHALPGEWDYISAVGAVSSEIVQGQKLRVIRGREGTVPGDISVHWCFGESCLSAVHISNVPDHLYVGQLITAHADGSPEGGTFEWSVVQPGGQVQPTSGTGSSFTFTAQNPSYMTSDVLVGVTYTSPNGATSNALRSLTVSNWDQPGIMLCSTEKTIPLDAQGEFTLPDWTIDDQQSLRPFIINPLDYWPPITVIQDPPPGLVVHGPSTLPVNITVDDALGNSDSCQVRLDLVDKTSPQITISGVASGDRFVAPAQVIPTITAVDETDPSPRIEAFLDGEPYTSGTPISSVGLHFLRATAFDAAGNLMPAKSVLFEILPHPVHSATAVVSDLSCSSGPSGYATIDATILLASHQFDVRALNLYTLSLWSADETGFPISEKRIPIAGSINSAGGYDYAHTEAIYQNGYWTLHFRATVDDGAITSCPTHLLITGSGQRQQPDEFRFEAYTDAVVDPDPIGTLVSLGLVTQDPPMVPPVEQECPPCTWWKFIREGPLDSVSRFKSDTCGVFSTYYQKTNMVLWAKGGHFSGDAFALDQCFGDVSDAAAVTSSARIRLYMTGPECCKCKIHCEFSPRFKARVEVDGSGAEATAAGKIQIASACCNALAVDAIHVGGEEGISVGLGGGVDLAKKNVNVKGDIKAKQVSGKADEIVVTDFCTNDIEACDVTVLVGVAGKLQVMADGHLLNGGSAYAIARLWDASPGILLSGECLGGDGCEGYGEVIYK
ncbi:MAG: hypothetical protein HYX78_07900 [Armatimonadetes bacterium]|nr:hypothetical protein [Armatimonadota bacterium]